MATHRDLTEYLKQFITEKRLAILNRVLSERTRYLTVAMEDIYQPQNASAVLRTCECFGIQDVHIIENQNEYRINPDVVMGASKWLSLYRHNELTNNSGPAIETLRQNGYRIIATSLDPSSTRLEEFDLEKGKAALFFGTELTGLTSAVTEQADERLTIPIAGFTKSFNISVSVAIILHHLTMKLKRSGINWPLASEEKDQLRFYWLKQSIKQSELLISEFESRQKS